MFENNKKTYLDNENLSIEKHSQEETQATDFEKSNQSSSEKVLQSNFTSFRTQDEDSYNTKQTEKNILTEQISLLTDQLKKHHIKNNKIKHIINIMTNHLKVGKKAIAYSSGQLTNFINKEYLYYGFKVNGRAEGYGRLEKAKGGQLIYEGKFQAGCINQENCIFLEDDLMTKYVGPIFKDKRQGKGVIYKPFCFDIENPDNFKPYCDDQGWFKYFEGTFENNQQSKGVQFLYSDVPIKGSFDIQEYEMIKGQKHGQYKCYSKSADTIPKFLKEIGQYQDDKAKGVWKYYNKNGKLGITKNFDKTDQNDFLVQYHKNGCLKSMGNDKKTQPNSFSITMYKSGTIHQIEKQVANRSDQKLYAIFNINKKIVCSNSYSNKSLGGICKTYHQTTGKLMSEESYSNGKLHGSSATYFETGETKSIESYYNGQKNGSCIYFYANGYKKIDSYYLNGKLHGGYT